MAERSPVIGRLALFCLAVALSCCLSTEGVFAAQTHALMIPMPDHVRLAADIVTPSATGRFPAVLVMTRYGRATRMSKAALRAFADAGLAIVLVDMRGSGASEGHVLAVFSREERADIAEIIAWIARQPWSDGRVVGTGVSYDANLAALGVAADTKALVASVPRFIDFDTYRDLALPGGVRNEMLLREWGALTDRLDDGTPCLLNAAACASLDNLEPVDGDGDDRLLRAALLDHRQDWHAYQDTMGYAFDDDVTPTGRLLREGFLSSQAQALAKSRIPVQIWGSWFDAHTADSALAWYAHAPNSPIELYLGAWTHGGGHRVDPFLAGSADDEAGAPVPAQVFLDFVHGVLTDPARAVRVIHYYTAGAAVWRRTASWPPSNIVAARWYLDAGNRLDDVADGLVGDDSYAADFSATTGKTNRWTTQLGGGPVDYGDRAVEDRKCLTYTSPPLAHDIEITGAPILTLHLASTLPDAALFVYLEAVQPGGRSIYLSEGELRLPLRGGTAPDNRPAGVAPSFLRADAAYLAPGKTVEIGLKLATVSVMIPKGDRLRIALAGADADTFARYPADGDPVLTVHRTPAQLSYVDMPEADWNADAASAP